MAAVLRIWTVIAGTPVYGFQQDAEAVKTNFASCLENNKSAKSLSFFYTRFAPLRETKKSP